MLIKTLCLNTTVMLMAAVAAVLITERDAVQAACKQKPPNPCPILDPPCAPESEGATKKVCPGTKCVDATSGGGKTECTCVEKRMSCTVSVIDWHQTPIGGNWCTETIMPSEMGNCSAATLSGDECQI